VYGVSQTSQRYSYIAIKIYFFGLAFALGAGVTFAIARVDPPTARIAAANVSTCWATSPVIAPTATKSGTPAATTP